MFDFKWDWLSDKLESIARWFVGLIERFLDALKAMCLWLFEQILNMIHHIISALPVPDFLHDSLQAGANGLLPLTSYLLGQSGVAQGFVLIGSAYVFRMLRKIVTLGQW